MSPKIRNIVTWVITALCGIQLVLGGVFKFLPGFDGHKYFEALSSWSGMPMLIGASEVLGGLGMILIPFLGIATSSKRKLRSLAGLGLLIILFGAVYAHYKVEGDLSNSGGAILAIVLVSLTIFLWSRKPIAQTA